MVLLTQVMSIKAAVSGGGRGKLKELEPPRWWANMAAVESGCLLGAQLKLLTKIHTRGLSVCFGLLVA